MVYTTTWKVLIQTPQNVYPTGVKRRKRCTIDNKDDSFEMEMPFGEKIKPRNSFIPWQNAFEFDTLLKNHYGNIQRNTKPKSKHGTCRKCLYAPTVRIATDKDNLNSLTRCAKLDRERDVRWIFWRFRSTKVLRTQLRLFDQPGLILIWNRIQLELKSKGSQVTAVSELCISFITTKVSAKFSVCWAVYLKVPKLLLVTLSAWRRAFRL
jgi:hypothetical protein